MRFFWGFDILRPPWQILYLGFFWVAHDPFDMTPWWRGWSCGWNID